MTSPTNGFTSAIKNDQSLALFINKMKQFDRKFCDAMASGGDFTIRLEVHGQKGEIIHVRLYTDDIDRPGGKERGKQ